MHKLRALRQAAAGTQRRGTATTSTAPSQTAEASPCCPSSGTATGSARPARPMLSAARRETLGSMYSLVGTHSAVKLCRWQKSMMRNRGGCYKWTFYGIRSHQCMEATPSMACANKCAFCWRLNTNPTTTEWKWDVDDPIVTAKGMIEAHKALIKNSSGMPGVTEDRLSEAMTPRHCALSLVGEPIIYPRINEFLTELHRQKISTFMVNNGQFPDAITALDPVTQLYLSVDGPSKEVMKKLDRPAFPDFWERFNESVRLMKTKPGRKVFRLTMIEDVNMADEHIAMYANMVRVGEPHFVELKQLTPAFQGLKTFLRISNVPTWERILDFGKRLCDALEDSALPGSQSNDAGGVSQQVKSMKYGLACAHEHSHCLLLAQKDRFYEAPTASDPNGRGKWYTWIDFERFHEIMAKHHGWECIAPVSSGEGGTQTLPAGDAFRPFPNPKDLVPEDYMLETPAWATFGAPEDGFDPDQQRFVSNKKKAHLAASAAGNGTGTNGTSQDAAAVGDDEEEELR